MINIKNVREIEDAKKQTLKLLYDRKVNYCKYLSNYYEKYDDKIDSHTNDNTDYKDHMGNDEKNYTDHMDNKHNNEKEHTDHIDYKDNKDHKNHIDYNDHMDHKDNKDYNFCNNKIDTYQYNKIKYHMNHKIHGNIIDRKLYFRRYKKDCSHHTNG